MRQQYTHSGRVPPLGVVLGFSMVLLTAVPLSYLYDYGIIHVPYVKLRLIFTMSFGALAGAAAGWGMVLGKVRNNRIAGFVGIAASLAALYASWGTWLILVFDKPLAWLPNLLARPVAIWRLAELVNAEGTWGMSGGSATKGTGLWIIWALEAGTIILCGIGTAFLMIKSRAFCENCEHWSKKAGRLIIAPTMQREELMTRLNQGGLDFLANAAQATIKQARYTFTWYTCPSCSTLNTLNVMLTQPKNNKQMASHLLISAAEVDQLRNMQAKITPVMATAAAR